jgi:hypothetical protein
MTPTRQEMIADIFKKSEFAKYFKKNYYDKFTDEQIKHHWLKLKDKPNVKTSEARSDASKPRIQEVKTSTVELTGFNALEQ